MAASKTTNSGATWTPYEITTSDGFTSALVVDHSNSDIIYAGGKVGSNAIVYKTTNSGANWSSVSSGLSSDTLTDLMMDPQNRNILYVGTPNGVYKTTNAGSSWSNKGLTDVISIAIDPIDPNVIYAGTKTGVYKSINGGNNWAAMNDGLDNTDITYLALDPGDYLFAGTNGSSVYRYDLNMGIEEQGRINDMGIVFSVKPNPAHGTTNMSYQLATKQNVDLAVYDVQGRLVKTLVNDVVQAGTHVVTWYGMDNGRRMVPAGVYFTKLRVGKKIDIQKLVLFR